MGLTIGRMKKDEIVWMASHHCKHRHTYLAHQECYLKEHPDQERVGYFDIETSHLKADFGLMLCYSIKVAGKDEILSRSVTNREIRTCMDEKVVRKCVEDLSQFDRIVTYYGKGFDVKFVRTRAVSLGIEFPTFGSMIHDDVYFMIRNRFLLSRNRMENACRNLVGATEKTHMDPRRWIQALQGDAKAIAWIQDHCNRDVRDLERLHKKVVGFSRRQDCSL